MRKRYNQFLNTFCLIGILSGSIELQAKAAVNLLFVGITGAGISTTINTIYNIAGGKDCSDEKDIIIPLMHYGRKIPVNVESFKALAPALQGPNHSQTVEIQKYTLEAFGYLLNVYDTPGFLDS